MREQITKRTGNTITKLSIQNVTIYSQDPLAWNLASLQRKPYHTIRAGPGHHDYLKPMIYPTLPTFLDVPETCPEPRDY